MSDPLSIGYSALESYKAISITGNNIANVNTEGYSRQIATFDERPATASKYQALNETTIFISAEVQERTAVGLLLPRPVGLAVEHITHGPATSAAGVLDNSSAAGRGQQPTPPRVQVPGGATLTDRFQFDGRIQALAAS